MESENWKILPHKIEILVSGVLCVSGQEKQQQNIRESALTGGKIHIFVWQAGWLGWVVAPAII